MNASDYNLSFNKPSAIFVSLCLLSVCAASGVPRLTAAGALVLESLVVSLTLIACLWKVHLPC